MRLLDPIKILWKNSLSISASRILLSGVFFILSLIIARSLGPAALGSFAVVMSLFSIAEFISTLGMDSFLIRELAKDSLRAQYFFSRVAGVGLLSSAGCFILMVAASLVLNYPPEIKKLVCWVGIVLFPVFINYLCETLLIALHRAKDVLVTVAIRETLLLVLSAVFLWTGWGLLGIVWAMFLSRVTSIFLYKRQLSVGFIFCNDRSFLKNFFHVIPVFFFIALMSILFLEIDILILGKEAGLVPVGMYSAAKKILRALVIFIFGFGTVIFPVISASFLDCQEKTRGLYRTFLKNMLVVSVGLSLAGLVTAPWIVGGFFGPAFSESVGVFQIMVLSLIPVSLSFLWSRFLIASEHQGEDLLGIILGTVALFSFGIILGGSWGASGMAWAVVAASYLTAGVHYYFFRKYVFSQEPA